MPKTVAPKRKTRQAWLETFGVDMDWRPMKRENPINAREWGAQQRERFRTELKTLLERGDIKKYYELRSSMKPLMKDEYLDKWVKNADETARSQAYVGQKKNDRERDRYRRRVGKFVDAVMNGRIRKEPLGTGSVFVVRGMKDLYHGDAIVVKFRERGVERAPRLADLSIDAGVEASNAEARKSMAAHREFVKAAGEENVARFYFAQMMLPKETVRKGQKVVMAPREVYVFERVSPLVREEYGLVNGNWALKGVSEPSTKRIMELLPQILWLNKKAGVSGLSVDSSLRNYGVRLGTNKVVLLDTLHAERNANPFYKSTVNLLGSMNLAYKAEEYAMLKDAVLKETERMLQEEEDEGVRDWLEGQYKLLKKDRRYAGRGNKPQT